MGQRRRLLLRRVVVLLMLLLLLGVMRVRRLLLRMLAAPTTGLLLRLLVVRRRRAVRVRKRGRWWPAGRGRRRGGRWRQAAGVAACRVGRGPAAGEGLLLAGEMSRRRLDRRVRAAVVHPGERARWEEGRGRRKEGSDGR
jgi:hypothetical protein